MQLKSVSGWLIMIALLSGCRAHPAAPMAKPADDDTLTRTREAFKRIDPQSQVGLVIATLPEDRLVAVGDVPVRDFHPNDLVMFVDSEQNPLTSGTVVVITGDALHVRYDPPTGNRRAPRVGDLAVKVK